MPKLLPVKTIVIFDGVCTLCNSTVDFLLRNDASGRLHFGAFQSVRGAELLHEHGVTTAPETIYVIDGGRLYSESDAVLHISRYLKWPWKLAGVLFIFPRILRNAIYRFVARNRYVWFGKKETCRIPTPEERSRFL